MALECLKFMDNDTVRQQRLYRAGLLHDLRKLQVPDKILDFSGGLEGKDLAVMRHHSYVTYVILSKIGGLEDISLWAANHHEKIDGSGYPFRRTGNELSTESRIIIVADIFQALAQNRPYRGPLPPEMIVKELKQQANAGKLDPDLVQLVNQEIDQCYKKAITPETGLLQC